MVKKEEQARSMRKSYELEKKWCRQFLEEFCDPRYQHPQFGQKKYYAEMQKVLDKQNPLFEVHFEDLEEFFSGDQYKDFLASIRKNTLRYIKMFTQAADQFKVESTIPMSAQEELENQVLNTQLQNFEKKVNDRNTHLGAILPESAQQHTPGPEVQIRDTLKRRFTLVIVPGPNSKVKQQKLRELRGDMIGSLVDVRATVVRVSEVQPLIELATFFCDVCNEEVFKTVNSKIFMPPTVCNSELCQKNNTKGNLQNHFAMSKFTSYQELKIQETSDQTPVGSIPRTFTVLLRGDSVRQCSPGDIIRLHGIYLTKPHDGVRNIRDQFLHETFIEGMKIEKEKKSYDSLDVNKDLKEELVKASKKEDHLSKLARSIAPEIFGLEDVKKALLYQMASGSTISFADGLKIRGDINIALIGDPGVAKSQLLKQIAHLTPRGVYTTGKGSSGAGLTASITRDSNSGEITLEGGALVLADLGICCIDEFDKMEDHDKTSIHEVMEQQTISLAKAGITTSLKARASILAAANPIWGRYNRAKTPHENIGLAHSLLSRFDLIFILLDVPQRNLDQRLAEHITYVHKNFTHPKTQNDVFDTSFLKVYLSHARTFNPTLGPELHDYVTNIYLDRRKCSRDMGSHGQYITPRSLLGIIRFSQAIAKLRFSNQVNRSDVDEAVRLMDIAISSVNEEGEEQQITIKKRIMADPTNQIYKFIKEIFKAENKRQLHYKEVEKRIIARGFDLNAFKNALNKLENDDNLLMHNHDTETIALIH